MKVAVMQPYFAPYIGYFQLINSVDKFVVYDDVNFIKKGWINRNNILVGGKAQLFTIPLVKASQNKLINELEISEEGNWRSKLKTSIDLGYRKAPQFLKVFPLLESIIDHKDTSLSGYVFNSISRVHSYLQIKTEIVATSSVYGNQDLKGQNRILDICLKEKATQYINPPGGKALYTADLFKSNHIELLFLEPGTIRYKQFVDEFVPWLSIIDVLMFCDVEAIKALLRNYSLTHE